MPTMKVLLATALWSVAASGALAQQVEKNVGIVAEQVASQMQAFSYREGPVSRLEFRSTAIALAAEGSGLVEFQDGRSRVRIWVRKLPQPATLGPYATYILWAVTIDGRAMNLGAIEVTDGRGELKTSASLSQFALIVTAEPHFAVTAPSRGIVLRNLADIIKGEMTMIAGLAERMDYSGLAPQAVNAKARLPNDLIQARYAVRIAELAQAGEFAAASFSKAGALLTSAETAQASKKSRERKEAPRLAREAAQAHAGLIRDLRGRQRRIALISGGETTVRVTHPDARGGRNGEYLLALALALGPDAGVHALAADTDGRDGTGDNAGALLTPDTLKRAADLGLDAQGHLTGQRSYDFFAVLGDLVVTGPTRTNVNDLRIALIH